MKKMLIDAAHKEELRVAIIDQDEKLDDYEIEATTKDHARGNIYVGEVTRVEPSLQAAFISFGGNRNGFLAFSEVHPIHFDIPEDEKKALLEEYNAVSPWGSNDDDADNDADTSKADDKEADKKSADANDSDSQKDDKKKRPTRARRKDSDDDKKEEIDLKEVAKKDAEASGEGLTSEELEEDARALALANAIAVKPLDKGNRRGGHMRTRRRNHKDSKDSSNNNHSRDNNNNRSRSPRPVPVHRRYEMDKVLKPGQKILVQLVKEERGSKGAALTTFVSLPGRFTVLMPNTPYAGGISRKITAPEERRELKQLTSQLEVPHGMGLIVRTAGLGHSTDDIRRDVEHLQNLWNKINSNWQEAEVPSCIYEEGTLIVRALRDMLNEEIEEVIIAGKRAYSVAKDYIKTVMPDYVDNVVEYEGDVPLFSEYDVEMELHQLHRIRVTLPSGGYLIINPTEALISIDVNSGRNTNEKNIEQTAYQTNLEAAREIGRQLRLRDLAGLVVVDFIDMEDRRNERHVERAMRDAVRRDRARIQVGDISSFGLLEMSRQRLRPSIGETSFEPCPHCHGSGRVRSASSAALLILRRLEEDDVRGKADRIVITTSAAVAIYMLNHKREMVREYEECNKARVIIQSDDKYIAPDHRLDLIRVSADGSEKSHTIETIYREDQEENRKRGKRRPKQNRKEASDNRKGRSDNRRSRNNNRRDDNKKSKNAADKNAGKANTAKDDKAQKPVAKNSPEKTDNKPAKAAAKRSPRKVESKNSKETAAKPTGKDAGKPTKEAAKKATTDGKQNTKSAPAKKATAKNSSPEKNTKTDAKSTDTAPKKPVNTPVLVQKIEVDEKGIKAKEASVAKSSAKKESALQRWWKS